MYGLIKVLTVALLMPLPLFAGLILLGLGLFWWRKLRVGLWFSFLGLMGLLLASWAPVADRLIDNIESQTLSTRVLPKVDYIMVLGAGWKDLGDLSATQKLSDSSARRLMEGLRLAHEQPQAVLVVSGASRLANELPIALGYQQAAQELGIAAERIRVLDTPVDTGQEAKALVHLLATENNPNAVVALVTAASHMPRALAHFQNQGIQVLPVATQYMAYDTRADHLSYWIPSAHHLRKTERAWYEWLAMRAVRFEH